MYNQMNPYQINSGLKRINWGNVLNNTQKTLNVINQAIPIIYQVKPLVANARTLFRIADAVNDEVKEVKDTTSKKEEEKSNLQFFL